MVTRNNPFNAVKMTRSIRDAFSEQIKDRTFDEERKAREREIEGILDGRRDQNMPEITAIMQKVRSGRWVGAARIEVARWLETRMRREQRWKEKALRRIPLRIATISVPCSSSAGWTAS